MLSCLQHLLLSEGKNTHLEFCAAGPMTGPLADQLHGLNVPLVSFQTHDSDGVKLSPEQLQSQMQSVLNTVNPDLVHANSLSMSRNVGRMSDDLFRTTMRSGHLRDIIKLSRAAINDLNRNHGLVAVSDATKKFHISRGLNSDICQTIYNGVDTTVFQPADQIALRQHWFSKLPTDAIVLLNVGQICLRKGQKDLADAVVQLLPDYPQLHLALAGNRHSTKAESVQYERSILEAFTQRSLRSHLHLLGYQPEVSKVMNASDVLVHAAKQEPLGRVLLEAASGELPIIATDVGGTSEILTDGEHARLVSPSTQALAAAIREFLDHQDEAKNRASAARSRILQTFDVSNAAERLAAYWRKLLLSQHDNRPAS